MNTTQTSLIALHKAIKNGTVGKQQATILTFFMNNSTADYSNSEVSQYTGIKLSSVCARMKELREANYLTFSQRRGCRVVIGSTVNTWKLTKNIYISSANTKAGESSE